MKCDKCHSNKADVHIEEMGDYCLDCFNAMMAEELDVELYENYAKNISIVDNKGKVHHFNIIHEMNPMGSVWVAEEIGGEYRFEVMIDHKENQEVGVRHLHSKIIKGISCKTLELIVDDDIFSNSIKRDNKQYRLKDIGSFRIEYDQEKDENCVIIDGIKISYEEFVHLFDSYEGYSFDYQVRDASDEVLSKEMVLKQVDISVEKIYDRFMKTISWFLDEEFLSWKNEANCNEALFETIDDLTLLYNYGDRDDCQLLGEKIIEFLESIETDAEEFPEYIVDLIHELYE